MNTETKKFRVRVFIRLLAFCLAVTSVFITRADLGQASEEEVPVLNKSSVWYTVQKGDSLWAIAEKFNVNLDLLVYVNELNTDDILKENAELIIPEGDKIRYAVKQGDTLWDIADKFNTTVENLARENGPGVLETLRADREIVIPVDGNVFSEEVTLPDEHDDGEKLDSWPVNGVVSSEFGRRWGRMHKGIDIAANTGEPIRAVGDGVVVFAGDRGTYGNAVIINHGDGLRTLYAHASRVEVSAGQKVKAGEIVARVGNTGRSTGPHLHFEVLYKGTPVDPSEYLPMKM